MSVTAKPRTVPQSLYLDLARMVQRCRAAQTAYFDCKGGSDKRRLLNEARDWERRLDQAAAGAVSLVKTTPPLFAEDPPPPANPLPTRAQVMRYLEREIEVQRIPDEQLDFATTEDLYDSRRSVRVLEEVIEIINPDAEMIVEVGEEVGGQV